MTYADGTGAFGVPDNITIGTGEDAEIYVVENLTPKKSVRTKERMNKDGDISTRRHMANPDEFSATLQLEDDAQPLPTTAAEAAATGVFTIPASYGGGSGVITEVSPKYVQDDFTKVDISFYRKINA